MSDLFIYHILASEYGWTVKEVDETPMTIIWGLLEILSEQSESMAMTNRMLRMFK